MPTQAKQTLDQLPLGAQGVIDQVQGPVETAQRLMQMGLWTGETVIVRHKAPLGGPLEIELMDYRLAIRREDAQHITLR